MMESQYKILSSTRAKLVRAAFAVTLDPAELDTRGQSTPKESVMIVSFPAMRGEIGQRTYFSCLMKLASIPKMFTFRDWAEFTPEEREQRVLTTKRVPQIAKYITDKEDGYLFASI